MLSEQERRSLEGDVRNCKAREAEYEAKLKTIPLGNKRHTKWMARLNETLEQRLRSEARLRSGGEETEKEASKLPRIFLVCILHSRPGEPILATMKNLDAENWVAICPACIEQGKDLRDKLKLQLGREEVKVANPVDQDEIDYQDTSFDGGDPTINP